VSKYDELITDCHDNPMYAADIILSLEKQVTALEAENKAIREAFEESEYPELFWDECEKLLENEQ